MLNWFRRTDHEIDELIHANRAKPTREGYDKPDHAIIDRIGDKAWQDAVKAQERQR